MDNRAALPNRSLPTQNRIYDNSCVGVEDPSSAVYIEGGNMRQSMTGEGAI